MRFVEAGIGGEDRVDESLASDCGTAVVGCDDGGIDGEVFSDAEELAFAVKVRFEADGCGGWKRGGWAGEVEGIRELVGLGVIWGCEVCSADGVEATAVCWLEDNIPSSVSWETGR